MAQVRMFWQRAESSKPVSEVVKQALLRQQGITGDTLERLSIVQESGSYSGRKVTYFRVFDATKIRDGKTPRFNEIDPESILHSGHIEADGQIVLKSNKAFTGHGEPVPGPQSTH